MSVRLMGRKAYFGFLIPSPFNFRCDWRVFQAVFLSYTLANRRLVPYLASYTRFHVLHCLQRGYRQSVLHSHTLPYRFGIFPRVQQAPPASYTLVCSLALRIRTTPCAKVCNNFRLVHDRNVRRKKSLFRMWDF